MRASVLLTSACAAMVVASRPEKRDEVLVTSYDVVYETKIVTVTLGQDGVEAAIATSTTTTRRRGGRKTRTLKQSSTQAAVTTSDAVPVASVSSVVTPVSTVQAVATSSAAPAPTSEAPAPTSEAPAPVVSAAPESTYVAPAPSSAPVSSAPAPVAYSVAPSVTSSPAPVASTGTATTYQQAAVQRHNLHRANHGAGAVTWSQDLADAAMIDAKKCTFEHWPAHAGMSYGQNLALGSGPGDIAAIITSQWYAEQTVFAADKNYDLTQPPYGTSSTDMSLFEQWGHFTQVVWKATTQIGCATWECGTVYDSSGNAMPSYSPLITYCFYSTPGNYAGEYAANVSPPTSTTVIPDDQGVDISAIAAAYGGITGQTYSA